MQENFKKMNEYYDKIYVLSLPRLTERIAYINNALKGLNFEFFFGTDKQTISMTDMKQRGLYSTSQYQRFYKRPKEISLGMLCCSLGHLKIYQDIVRNNYKRTLILEDDVLPLEEGLNHFSHIIHELPSDWQLLYLGYEKNENYGILQKIKQLIYKIFPRHSQLKLSRKIFSRYYPVDISAHIAKAGFHDCTHAYSITLEAAKKLIQQQQPIRFHADNLLSYMICNGQLQAYIAKPKVFNQLSAFANKIDSLTSD
ncbi:MAG: glycosyltransferase family 25 protein [Chitinophagaceae bacterium]